jgi:integrase
MPDRDRSPLVEEFLSYIEHARNLSPNTVATYRRTLRSFAGVETAGRDEVEAWWKSREGLAVSTRLNELAGVRSFYKWCRRFDHRDPMDDPTYRIEPPRKATTTGRPISHADLTHLLRVLPEDLRRAVCLGAYAGLRVHEAAGLLWSDVDLESRRLYVRGKGGKERVVGLSPVLLDGILPARTGSVVTGGHGTLTGASLQRKVNRAIRAAGVDATFHQLRHRFGTMAVASAPLVAVSRAMGHASVSTTAIYVAASDTDLDVIAEAVSR